MVSIKCQSQYNALILAGGSLSEAGGRPGPSSRSARGPRPAGQSGSPRPAALPERGAGSGERALRAPRPGRAGPGGPGRAGRRLKQIHGLHFCRLPGGDGAGGGSGSCERAELPFLSPLSPQSELQAYMVKGKKIIKKTYKITIEKVILLGEAPLRLRGAFVLLLIYIFLNVVSLRPREYRLFGQEFSRVLGEPP